MEKLLPFAEPGARLTLDASIGFDQGKLHLRFALSDPAGEVLGGPVNGEYRGLPRYDGLWQRTCFEAFFALRGEDAYWELNLAPDGSAWNLYRFRSYRLPQPPTPSDDFTLDRVLVNALTLDCWLSPQTEPAPLEASLCAVVRTAAGAQYFSTRHSGEKPDFHVRNSFVLAVSP